ncbi:MAG: tRNA (adenosine(37)-N6)-threonylcarbamoyltransferase complex dimerization subunit type 1 TsaB [Deltaproteobacteria bacterium]|nr:tRNA (adenosine(37)-N6)-threonylcarbamoyltransferase complex dimerization subunit type 1 TsaB [Deltaproteobacteria bacterium]MBN2673104.1 tRNA (adenosine(37)-N6)-threonylcarbamoyltransferase complex dimerization subunit type 1 TsaB [Deltaproteobacteria bacterium]
MLILVFDTSTKNGTVGWVKTDDTADSMRVVDWAHTYMPAIPGHAERLLERIDFCLKSGGFTTKDVNLIVIGRGPGTFTGLRIGFSTAKALSLAHQIPLVTVSTLEMLARNAAAGGTVAALLDARRKEVYMGVYRVDGSTVPATVTALMPECVISPDGVATALAEHHIDGPVQLVGDGAVAYADKLAGLGAGAAMNTVGFDTYQAALCGVQTFQTDGPCDTALAEPLYLREPDAKKPKSPFGSAASN